MLTFTKSGQQANTWVFAVKKKKVSNIVGFIFKIMRYLDYLIPIVCQNNTLNGKKNYFYVQLTFEKHGFEPSWIHLFVDIFQ